MKNNIAYRIRKLRESKDYSQENMAGELGISTSAYSKIERGITDPSVGRIGEIAKILEVDIIFFFQESTTLITKTEDDPKPYGFATKNEVEELTQIVNKLKQEIASLKTILQKPEVKKKKK
ncbi:helix-turn-helix domain-containing protein [Ferruginibacter sp. SUN106]|uniref:helix-turn-helix domain-containing protein n=1 Tax=Ferruginibacter sp. SUN106 TaxID=2978348 RepID=UPI003D36FC14